MDATNKMEEIKEESRIRMLTRKELLIQFYNAHLRQYIADAINLRTFEKANDNDVFAIVPVQVPGGQGMTQRKVTVKEQKVVVKNGLTQQSMLLSTMEELLSNEGVEVPAESKAKNLTNKIPIA